MSEPTTVAVPTRDGEMPALRWLPEGGRGPGLVLLQEIFGLSDYVRDRGRDLAALGYVVLAPELYWRIDQRGVDESRDDFLEQAFALMQRLDWDTVVADAGDALHALRADDAVEGGAGLLGFCFGGGVAFDLASRTDPDVLVSYYGSAIPHLLERAPSVSAPSLHHFGLADAFIPPETVEGVRAAVDGPETDFHTWEGAGHAFDNPHPVFHHAEAAAGAWDVTAAFLAGRLPTR